MQLTFRQSPFSRGATLHLRVNARGIPQSKIKVSLTPQSQAIPIASCGLPPGPSQGIIRHREHPSPETRGKERPIRTSSPKNVKGIKHLFPTYTARSLRKSFAKLKGRSTEQSSPRCANPQTRAMHIIPFIRSLPYRNGPLFFLQRNRVSP